MTKKSNAHEGSTFDAFLSEEGIREEVLAVAFKRVLAWQLEQAMKKANVTKTELASRMRTSRAAVDRLLDPENIAVTLQSMARAATALGGRLNVTLEAAS